MIIIFFIFGLIVGSFLNAVIFRLHSGESFLLGRSHCMHCKHELAPLDLVPVFSFIFLSGKCRYCKSKLSWQYPIVEFLTGLIFAVLFAQGQMPLISPKFLFELVMAGFFIVVGVFDLKHYLILDKVVFPGLVVVLIYNIFAGQIFLGLISGFGVAGFFLLQYVFSKGKWIGFGDVKFGLLLGNFASWPMSLVLIMLAYFLGAIVGIVLILSGKKKLGSKLPFGVFLSASAIITMIIGERLLTWYLRLIGL